MGVQYHAKNNFKAEVGSDWAFEEIDCQLSNTMRLLVRVMIGNIVDKNRVVDILRNRPIRQGQPGWNCVSWVKEALETLWADPKALGTSVTGWDEVSQGALDYCQRKKDQHRFDGKGSFDMTSSSPLQFDSAEGGHGVKLGFFLAFAIVHLTQFLHRQFLRHGLQEIVNLMDPQSVLWTHLVGSSIFPV